MADILAACWPDWSNTEIICTLGDRSFGFFGRGDRSADDGIGADETACERKGHVGLTDVDSS